MKIVTAMFTALVVLSVVACNEKERQLTPKEIKKKADSTVATRVDELKQAAAEDLDRRMTIEVKGKTDSIVDAYIQSQSPAVNTDQQASVTTPAQPQQVPPATPDRQAPARTDLRAEQ